MKIDTKNLHKAAREVYSHIHSTQNFSFHGPEYNGLSEGLFQQLDINHLDALVAAVDIWAARLAEGQSVDASGFLGIVDDCLYSFLPEIHDKHDKPGKKHGRKDKQDDFERSFKHR